MTRLLVLGRLCSVHRLQPLRGPRPSTSQAEHSRSMRLLRGRGQEAVGKQRASLGPLPAPSRQLPVAKQLLFLWRLQRLWLIGEAPPSSSFFLCGACLCSLHLNSKLGCSSQLPPPPPPQNLVISEVWTRLALLLTLPFRFWCLQSHSQTLPVQTDHDHRQGTQRLGKICTAARSGAGGK